MDIFPFFILSLATWRIANMLVAEDGPWMIFERLRLAAGLQPPPFPDALRETDPPGEMPGSLFSCVWCISVWIATGFSLFYLLLSNVAFWVAVPLALSSVSCLIDRWGNK